jgi:hypothetical protein
MQRAEAHPSPHVGQPCPKSPDKSVHFFCFAGLITDPWEQLAKCKWCGITPNGELVEAPR